MMPTYSGDSDGEDLDESGELPQDDDEDGEEQEASLKDEPAVAKTVAPTTPAPPPLAPRSGKKKRVKPGKPGEKRRGPPAVREAAGLAGVAQMNAEAGHPPPGAPVREVMRAVGKIDPTQEATGDILERWPLVLEALAQEGLGADAVTLRVTGMQDGPYASQPTFLGAVDGRMLVGGGDISPADALASYIENVYHSGMRGPVRYQIDVLYKVTPPDRPKGSNNICRGYLSLQPYDIIVARRRREEEHLRQQAALVGQSMPPAPRFIPQPAPGMGGFPQHPVQPQQGMQGMYAPPPPTPSYSDEMMREIFARLLRGETIGPQAIGAPAPVVYPPPPPPPLEPPPPPPTLREQLQDFAEMMKLVQSLQPPPPQVVQAPAVGVGRAAREEAAIVRAAAPESALDQLKGAMAMLREASKIREELAGLAGNPIGGDDEDDEPPAPKEAPPFSVMELPGGVKWPHAKGLGRIEQIQQFAMLNPDMSLKFVQGLSKILDQSILRQLLEFLVQRGNPAQQQAAQQAMQQGLGGAPQHLPPVVRPVSAPPPAPAANGAVPHAGPPATPIFPVSSGFSNVT